MNATMTSAFTARLASVFGRIHRLTFTNTRQDREMVMQGLRAPSVGRDFEPLSLRSESGAPVDLGDPMGRPLVLIFYRGVWCPSCSGYIRSLGDSAEDFERSGARVFAISTEGIEDLRQMRANAGLPESIGLLSDPMGLLGEQFSGRYEGKSYFRPAAIVIGRDGKVAFEYANDEPRIRATAHEILAVLRRGA